MQKKERKNQSKKQMYLISIIFFILRRNGVALIVNKRVQNAVPGCSQNDRITSVHFQGKSFNITVIQVYAPTTNAEAAEVEQFYEDHKTL